MYLTYKELRDLKHSLPTGSISRIAEELQIDEQTVRNYFGANKYDKDEIVGRHIQPGPNGGVVEIQDTKILELAKKIISENSN
jgi:predicted transcriptional regulator